MAKTFLLLFTTRSACVFFVVGLAMPARAEVTVNPQALDPAVTAPTAIPGQTTPPPKRAPAHHPAPHPAPPHATATQPARKPTGLIVPPAPPPAAMLQPLAPPPPNHTSIPPDPAPIVADAKGTAEARNGGLRIVFGAGSSDLNSEMDRALRQFARDSPQGIFNVVAYAAGVPDDPSTPRRLSLSRGLAARSLLIAEGIPSPRIYVRALGPSVGEGPPDRVDITVTVPPTPTAAAPAAPPPLPPPPLPPPPLPASSRAARPLP